ncbi:MAG TPA: lysyl oxidase family protein [Solirubrobacteraceae bacterium]|nr:lysyl oxidase family protein [Solirubrobacteraceae bacterium]
MFDMRRGRLAALTTAVALVAAAVAGGTAVGEAPAPRPELLPDLVPARAYELRVHERRGGRRELRFATAVFNRGTGPMEMYPMRGNDCDGDGNPRNDRLAKQRVYGDDNGDGRFDRLDDETSTARVAGCMIFHRAHDHWHFDDFASYRIVTHDTGQVVSVANKVSFCVEDLEELEPRLRGQPRVSYFDFCDPVHPQGISVGWADVYSADLPGQFVPLRGVRDGVYCLEMVTDPANQLRETNDANNVSRTRIRLRGDAVRRVAGGCAAPAPAPVPAPA